MIDPAAALWYRRRRNRAVEPPFPSGYAWRLRMQGITTASGDVASWDTEGGTALRFAGPTALERPAAVTVGSVTGAQTTAAQDYLISDATYQLIKPSIIWGVARCDTWSASERLIDFDSTPFLATFLNGATQTVRWEHGASDLNGTTAIASGGIYQFTVKLAASGGTSRLFVQAVENATVAATATAPAARVVGIGGTNLGAGKAAWTHLQWAVFPFASNAAMDAFGLTALHAYGSWLVSRAGG